MAWGLLSASIPQAEWVLWPHHWSIHTQQENNNPCALFSASCLFLGNQLFQNQLRISCSISSSQSHQPMGGKRLHAASVKSPHEVHLVPSLEFSQGSSPFLTRVAGYLQSMEKRVTPRLLWRSGFPLAFRVVHGVTGHLLRKQ